MGQLLVERQVERLLYREARLLDEWALEEWLTLFASSLRYWVPYSPSARPGEPALSLVMDDREHLQERIYRLRSDHSVAQRPRSRTCRSVTCVTVDRLPDARVRASTSQIVVELRHHRQRVLAAHCEFVLVDVSGGWLIESKRVDMVNQDEPLDDLTFLL